MSRTFWKKFHFVSTSTEQLESRIKIVILTIIQEFVKPQVVCELHHYFNVNSESSCKFFHILAKAIKCEVGSTIYDIMRITWDCVDVIRKKIIPPNSIRNDPGASTSNMMITNSMDYGDFIFSILRKWQNMSLNAIADICEEDEIINES